MTIKMTPYTLALQRMERLIAGLPDPAPFYKAFAEAIDEARKLPALAPQEDSTP